MIINNSTGEISNGIKVELSGFTQNSWYCDGQGNCSDPGKGNGQYASLDLCQDICVSTIVIKEHISNKRLLRVIDLLGKETKQAQQKNQLFLYIYDNGTIDKKIIFE